MSTSDHAIASERDFPSPPIYIGCAGWALRAEYQDEFPAEGSQLQRYADRLNCVEVNSCFYREHRLSTWQRWADSVPDAFRFSYKLPRTITHEHRLVDAEALVQQFAAQVAPLQTKQGPLLIQLPPSLRFDRQIVEPFLNCVRDSFPQVVLEPRHASWFTEDVDALLHDLEIGGVAADPPRSGQPRRPYGSPRLPYFRLHGSPKIYYSAYEDEFLQRLAETVRQQEQTADAIWCIFDNTAEGHAIADALRLGKLLGQID